MADGYGNIVTAWRCHVSAWVTSYTATTDTLHVEARWQAVNGYSLSGWVAATVWVNGQQVGHVANSGVKNVGTNSEVTICSGDLTVAKTDNARNITCSASIAFSSSWNGGTSTANVGVPVGGIQYQRPDPPKNASITRVDDTAFNLVWQSNWDNEALKPWKQIIVDRTSGTDGGAQSAWSNAAKLNWDAVNYRLAGCKPNGRYYAAIYARNGAGDSSHVDFGPAYTTPAAPASVVAEKIESGKVKLTIDVSKTYAYDAWIDRKTNDGDWEFQGYARNAAGTIVWTDENAPAGTIRYRAGCRRPVYGDDTSKTILTSDNTESNAVTTITPPLAPTITWPTAGVTVSRREYQCRAF